MACEILSCDNPVVLDFFFPSDHTQTEEKTGDEEEVKEEDGEEEEKLKEVVQNHVQQGNTEKGKKIKKENNIKKPLIHILLSYFFG